MKKPLLVLLLILLVASVAAAAAGLAGGRSASPPASSAQPVQHWCNFVMAGKDATADGSVMMGYNNDWSANNYQYLQVVPRRRHPLPVRQAAHAGLHP